jgi:hypothetical protein
LILRIKTASVLQIPRPSASAYHGRMRCDRRQIQLVAGWTPKP